ncbi:hypothetical protein NDU88_002466 [Pleurodeles waltl]|uniref:Uncharacterized protein n=1 Tax=Pleurodeles waltl TaxID=8319 RepID=A0AAV7W1Y3_PLEWA|nr:hypothetical protein NDU88_002466 [Pleurodeles waltl]
MSTDVRRERPRHRKERHPTPGMQQLRGLSEVAGATTAELGKAELDAKIGVVKEETVMEDGSCDAYRETSQDLEMSKDPYVSGHQDEL